MYVGACQFPSAHQQNTVWRMSLIIILNSKQIGYKPIQVSQYLSYRIPKDRSLQTEP